LGGACAERCVWGLQHPHRCGVCRVCRRPKKCGQRHPALLCLQTDHPGVLWGMQHCGDLSLCLTARACRVFVRRPQAERLCIHPRPWRCEAHTPTRVMCGALQGLFSLRAFAFSRQEQQCPAAVGVLLTRGACACSLLVRVCCLQRRCCRKQPADQQIHTRILIFIWASTVGLHPSGYFAVRQMCMVCSTLCAPKRGGLLDAVCVRRVLVWWLIVHGGFVRRACEVGVG
jgi:hypothetical protein